MWFTDKVFKAFSFCFLLNIMLGLFSGCGVDVADNEISLTSSSAALNESTSQMQDFIVPDWTAGYPSIIDEYRMFVNYIINDGIESVIDNNIFSTPDNNLAYNWSNMQIETNIWSYRNFPKSQEAFGYAVEDLNGDGNSELILLLQDYTVLALFTMSDGKPKLLDAFWPKHRSAIYDSRILYTLSSGGAEYWYYRIQEISSDSSELVTLEEYGFYEDYYKMTGGEKCIISESEFNDFQERYPVLSDVVASEITKDSGIKFTPLFD